MNASFCCIVLCTDRFALKLRELWGRNWQMFIFMLEKECLAGINKPTYFRQRNAIVASLFHHYQSDCCMHHSNVGWISGISALDHKKKKKKRLRCTQLSFFLSQALKISLWSAFLEFGRLLSASSGVGPALPYVNTCAALIEMLGSCGKMINFHLALSKSSLAIAEGFCTAGWIGWEVFCTALKCDTSG